MELRLKSFFSSGIVYVVHTASLLVLEHINYFFGRSFVYRLLFHVPFRLAFNGYYICICKERKVSILLLQSFCGGRSVDASQ